ncbi:unnamed protein product [Rotaria sp. Silwood1]|nr:unnamed protein product [Rotaria sp. Silwood1]
MNILEYYILFHLWLLLYVFIKQDRTLAVPQVDIDANEFLSVSSTPWIQLKINLGKDQLNAYHSRNTRANIMKTALIIMSVSLILLCVGGTISIIIYYVKKK